MTGSCLVANIAHQPYLVREATCKLFGIGDFSTAIAADVQYHAIAQAQVLEHVLEVAVANATGETLVHHIGNVVWQYRVLQAAAYVIVCAEVLLAEVCVEVQRIVFLPRPVAAQVEARGDVHMTVLQFGKHLAQHFEELYARHLLPQLALVLRAYVCPADAKLLLLVREEAIALVDECPKRIEVALRRIVVLILALLAGHYECRHAHKQKRQKPSYSHTLLYYSSKKSIRFTCFIPSLFPTSTLSTLKIYFG